MEIRTIRTRAFEPPRDDVYRLIDESVSELKDGDILCVSSKIVAIHQGRCIKITDSVNKDELITKEAERYIPRSRVPHALAVLAIKEHTLIASAGIDESNGHGYYILWPEQPYAFARELRARLKEKWNLNNLGVVLTDSHTIPLRYGVVGISIGFAGLHPVKSYVGTADIFGRPFHMSRTNVVDAIAAIAVLHMGEGNEQTPLAVLRDVPHVTFSEQNEEAALLVPPEDDIYRPLLDCFSESNE
ncbi:putative folate metabolism gamma-glutamate ligase [Candidatus Uhrbacteria bacterium CG10_big_fil_rev_8_21_14_0_10_48_11]|uniref:Putative folate metabolism gamma-glutamate ligase n=1 Tax=Candidatus Uhrbacteria bacterium CG10_big_fil_rev_8_21_14_0_10_48_11 TaxID=1975037 RepID=A0A2M8LDI0_9BACT|nr:MAG: putative folate metabolism gamma-glutamate ligase [Candidatus Uhrbacteria bacterium CG10_big_fil_rev_8_21_14_0_10_48_11]